MSWDEHVTRQQARYDDGLNRLPEEPDARQKQLTRIANAALGAGFAELMRGHTKEANRWLLEAASRYHESYEGAPPESWGRMIGAVKLRVIVGDWDGARKDARWTLGNGAAAATSPIGVYAACVAHLVLGDDGEAVTLAERLLRVSEGFPADVAASLKAIASSDAAEYASAVRSVVSSFETREEHLEEVPIADTALMLNALAYARGIGAGLSSPMLPATT